MKTPSKPMTEIEILANEVRFVKETLTDFKVTVKDGFDRVERSFTGHQVACRDDMGDMYRQITELQKESGRVNWSAVKTIATVTGVLLSVVALIVGGWIHHLESVNQELIVRNKSIEKNARDIEKLKPMADAEKGRINVAR